MSRTFVINLLVVLFSINLHAGIGGSSGGPLANSYTAEVCQINEAGDKAHCRMVEFHRQLNEPYKFQEPIYCTGEAQNTICDNPNARVPDFLKKD